MKTLTIQALIQQQRLKARGVPERILDVIQVKWLETKLKRWGLL